jgi:hypothetical protein
VAMVLVRAAWFRCKRQAELLWAAFEMSLYQSFAVAAVPRPLASMQQGDQARSRRIRLHLSFRPWLARYCGVPERNAPGRSQRDKNRQQRHV